eukprot:240880-Hanusia_phi.AAC.1
MGPQKLRAPHPGLKHLLIHPPRQLVLRNPAASSMDCGRSACSDRPGRLSVRRRSAFSVYCWRFVVLPDHSKGCVWKQSQNRRGLVPGKSLPVSCASSETDLT